MRIPFLSFARSSPFEGLQEHAEKVRECAWIFQQAMECYLAKSCDRFEEYRLEVAHLESDADTIRRRIVGHLTRGTRMAVPQFQFLMYLKEQDRVINAVEKSLDWVSFRLDDGVQNPLKEDLHLLVDSVIEPIEELSRMVAEVRTYFGVHTEKQRLTVKRIIHNLRRKEHEADLIEKRLKQNIFSTNPGQADVFYLVRLVEIIGSIADHAENASDMMRAMIARKSGFWKKR